MTAKSRIILSMLLLVVVIVGLTVYFTPNKQEADKEANIEVLNRIQGFTQGTTYDITIRSEERNWQPEIDSLLKIVDQSMSLYDSSSLLSRINRNETDSVDAFITDCIKQAAMISHQSDGLYDITIKPLTEAYGFTGSAETNNPNIDSLLQIVGYEKIAIENGRIRKNNPNIQIDLNSIAQGATSDYIGKYLDGKGIENYIINVGGEILSRGHKEGELLWRVGIDSPEEGNFTPGAKLIARFYLDNAGLATSGNYRKFHTNDKGEKITHTINPKTGKPIVSNLLSATVVAETSTLADAYGTMFMVMGLDESMRFLKTHPEIQACLVYSDTKGAFHTYITPELQKMLLKE